MPVTEVVLNITMSLLAILGLGGGAMVAAWLMSQQHGEGRAGWRGPSSLCA